MRLAILVVTDAKAKTLKFVGASCRRLIFTHEGERFAIDHARLSPTRWHHCKRPIS